MPDILCPTCGAALTLGARQWSCPKGHSFDVARQGYVNLLPVTQKRSLHPGDTREQVAARRAFLEAGFYTGRTALWFRSPGHPGRRLRRGILQRPGGSRAARRCPVRPGHLQRRCAFGRREVQIRHLALRHRCPSPLSTGKPGPDLEHVCPHGTRGISPGVGPRRHLPPGSGCGRSPAGAEEGDLSGSVTSGKNFHPHPTWLHPGGKPFRLLFLHRRRDPDPESSGNDPPLLAHHPGRCTAPGRPILPHRPGLHRLKSIPPDLSLSARGNRSIFFWIPASSSQSGPGAKNKFLRQALIPIYFCRASEARLPLSCYTAIRYKIVAIMARVAVPVGARVSAPTP